MNKISCKVPNNYDEKENVFGGDWDGKTYKKIKTDNVVLILAQAFLKSGRWEMDWRWLAQQAQSCTQRVNEETNPII